VQSYDLFGGNRVGFLKLRAEVTNSARESLPGAVFLRGPSVGMLVMLIPDDGDASSRRAEGEEEERYVLLTVQARIPAGSLAFAELPAGMVDDDASESEQGKFAGAAAREIYEELGIEIPASELVCLSDLATSGDNPSPRQGEEEGLASAMYPSPGGCDEYIPIYMHERRVPRDSLREWTGKLTGLREHGEKITLKLVPMRDLWREGRRDAKALAALALWEGLRREGKLQGKL
jgi:8-oxo-dGTP pyrophosphatase MutT (NUDIX family)